MTDRGRKILRLLLAMAIGVASLPLSLYSVDSHFGLGSVLIVPALAMGVWLLLTACEESRAWWFGFVISIGMFLPLCSWVERCLHSVAVYLQHLSQRGVLSPSQRVIEPTLIIMVLLCPLFAACLLGIGVGGFMRRLARSASRDETTESSDGGHWRFSVREMLIAVAAICLLAAWIGGQTRYWQGADERSQIAFLNRFKASFVSGEVELLAEPRIEEQQRTSTRGPRFMSFRLPSVNEFRMPGVNDYRIVAPIKTKDKELWAVWAYRCNGEANDFVYMFADAQASDEELLPTSLFPAMRYIEGTWDMVDGVPATAGPSATVISVTSPARVDQPIVLTASAPPGTVCELQLFPSDSLPSLPRERPDTKGNVTWSWNVQPNRHYTISYELRCIQKRGSATMVSTTRGSIPIVAPESSK